MTFKNPLHTGEPLLGYQYTLLSSLVDVCNERASKEQSDSEKQYLYGYWNAIWSVCRLLENRDLLELDDGNADGRMLADGIAKYHNWLAVRGELIDD